MNLIAIAAMFTCQSPMLKPSLPQGLFERRDGQWHLGQKQIWTALNQDVGASVQM